VLRGLRRCGRLAPSKNSSGVTNEHSPPARLRFGPFVLDARTAELTRNDARVSLPPQPVKVLALLAQRPGELVTRQEIQDAIWGEGTHVDFDRALNFAVKQIREALGDDADAPSYIETLRGRGYRFIAEVASELSPVETPSIAIETRPESKPPLNRRWQVAIPAGLAVVALAWLAFSRVGFGGDPSSIRSIVVLPVANLSGSAERDFIADGMTDAIITSLSQIESLRVISRTSAMTYKNAKKTIPDIARELGVDAVMEGTLQEGAGRVQLSIIVRDTGEHLWWSKTFERAAAEAAGIHVDVAQELAGRLGVPLDAGAAARLAATKTVDPKVYEAYIKGRYFWNRRSDEDVRRALEQFRIAIDIDPSFAPAYAGLADSYAAIGSYGFAAGEAAWQQALAAAEQALRLDPNFADGHTSRANVALYYEWDWDRGGDELRRALALNPGYATARHWYGYYHLLIGKPREAEAQIAAALQLDPLSPIINANIGFARYIGRDYDGAIAHLSRTLEMHPQFRLTHSYMGLAHVGRGAYADAIAAFEKAIDTGAAPSDRAVLAHALARGGRVADAKAILADLESPKDGRFVPAYYFALIHVGLGDKDRAFSALERAFVERVGPLNEIAIDPMFDLLRGDPRFDVLLHRLRLK
jgi:DNA-binding winged helix-turn-helix (wHTH) protein/TolB-like protein/Tfp pilus assembly protein PilF